MAKYDKILTVILSNCIGNFLFFRYEKKHNITKIPSRTKRIISFKIFAYFKKVISFDAQIPKTKYTEISVDHGKKARKKEKILEKIFSKNAVFCVFLGKITLFSIDDTCIK